MAMSIEDVEKIRDQITKWLNDYDTLNIDQFIALMNKIAPFVTQEDIREMYGNLDYQQNGLINKNELLQNDVLAQSIVAMYTEVSPIEDDDDSDSTSHTPLPKSPMSPFGNAELGARFEQRIANLQAQNRELQTWINDVGKPAQSRVVVLNEELEIFNKENIETNLELKAVSIRSANSMREQKETALGVDQLRLENDEISQSLQRSQDKIQSITQILNETKKKVTNLEKLNDELRQINEQYIKQNQTLMDTKKKNISQIQQQQQYILEQQAQIETILNDEQEIITKAETEVQNIKDSMFEEVLSLEQAAVSSMSPKSNSSADNNEDHSLPGTRTRTMRLRRLSGTLRSSPSMGNISPTMGGNSTWYEFQSMETQRSQATTVKSDQSGGGGIGAAAAFAFSNYVIQGDEKNQDFYDDIIKTDARAEIEKEMTAQFETEKQQIRIDAKIETQKMRKEMENKIDKLMSENENYQTNFQKELDKMKSLQITVKSLKDKLKASEEKANAKPKTTSRMHRGEEDNTNICSTFSWFRFQ